MRANEFIVEYKEAKAEDFHGLGFTLKEKYGVLYVKALNDYGMPIGQAEFNIEGNTLDPQVLWVDEKSRGIGVAKTMYDFIKSHGYEIHRSYDQTPDGKHFWDKNRGEDVRVWEDELTESLSRVAYHYTNIANAAEILKTGEFALSSSLASIEQQYAPAGYNYFLSTTRTKTGNYHRSRATSYGVIFALDGNWFNHHYISRPIDYWENRNPQSGHHRDSEAEDRVFSKSPTIPIGGVTAVHVLADPDQYSPHGNAMVRELLIAAKTRGIKTFLYKDFNAWADLDTRKVVPPTNLKGRRDNRWYRPKRKESYMSHWIELMMKTNLKYFFSVFSLLIIPSVTNKSIMQSKSPISCSSTDR